MVLTIVNQTANTRIYLAGTVSVSANSNFTASQAIIFSLAQDSSLIFDCINGNVTLSDGINTYQGNGAITYLTTINSSSNSSVIGYTGNSAPIYATNIGGKDPNGNTAVANLDIAGNLLVKESLPSSPVAGQITVPTAGTQVVIGSNILTVGVIIQALSTNVSNVYIGPTGVTSSNGFQLQPGQATSAGVSNLNALFVNAVTNGDGICYIGS